MKSKKRGGALKKNENSGVVSMNRRKRPVGYQRSMVRYIGSNVPIAPTQRAYFEVCTYSYKYNCYCLYFLYLFGCKLLAEQCACTLICFDFESKYFAKKSYVLFCGKIFR